MFFFVQFNLNFKVKIISIVQTLISKSLWITASLFMAAFFSLFLFISKRPSFALDRRTIWRVTVSGIQRQV